MEMQKVRVYRDRYVVAHTPETLVLADMKTGRSSEVMWNNSGGKEKFSFDSLRCCMVFNSGELSLIRYGDDDVFGSCRTEHMSPHLISLRLGRYGDMSEADEQKERERRRKQRALLRQQQRQQQASQQASSSSSSSAAGGGSYTFGGNEDDEDDDADMYRIAFLLDAQTICVQDLRSGVLVATINHDAKIDWLELNYRANRLLFRDKRCELHLFDITTQQRHTLLSYCTYAQWVPESDVAVAQNRQNLSVWYSIDHPDQITQVPIRGDVEEIVRSKGKTEVVVSEGIQQVMVPLDETLIAFGTAVDDQDLNRAMGILEQVADGSDTNTDGMWNRLSQLALKQGNLHLAERCFAALGQASRALFMHKVNMGGMVDFDGDSENKNDASNNADDTRARLALLNRQFKQAEAIYLQQGRLDKAVDMYRKLHKWEDALQVARSRGHSEYHQLLKEYYDHLVNSGQEEVAGALKEREGDYMTALHLYLRGGFPAKAADLVIAQGLVQDANVLERVANALIRKQRFEKAGEFLENLNLLERALEAYRRGHAFRAAVDLCRRAFPGHVVALEEEWGDWLASQGKMDAACNHYNEAGAYLKAINAAIEAKQWSKIAVIEHVNPEEAKPFLKRIAAHYEEIKRYDTAQRYYLQGGFYSDAVHMYFHAGQYDTAYDLASQYMKANQVTQLYVSEARKMESMGKLRQAEQLLVTVRQVDAAIDMYQRAKQWDNMMRLVSQHRPEMAKQRHQQLASQFAQDGNLKLAEQHYTKAGTWRSAFNMYRQHDKWDDALRVAKSMGGEEAFNEVAFDYAVSHVDTQSGLATIKKRDLAGPALDYALMIKNFEQAFRLCELCIKHRKSEVDFAFAIHMEDEGMFNKAEEHFVAAGKPREAIDMYNHAEEWVNAMRVAEQHDPEAIPAVFEAKAESALKRGEWVEAEQNFLSAKLPVKAIEMHMSNHQFDDATRLAKIHAPEMLKRINDQHLQVLSSGAKNHADFLSSQAALQESRGQYSDAIDTLLKITQDSTSDLDALEKHWEKAVSLAMSYVNSRILSVVDTVCKRLVAVGRYEAAAELQAGVDKHKEAIDTYIQGNLYEKAAYHAKTHASELVSYVKSQHEQFLISNDKIKDLQMVNPIAALEEFVARGDWDEVYSVAGKQGPAMVATYAALQAKQLVDAGKFHEALNVLAERGVSGSASTTGGTNLLLYERVAREVLGHVSFVKDVPQEFEESKEEQESHTQLRAMLFQLVADMRHERAKPADLNKFEQLLFIAHLAEMRSKCAMAPANLKPQAAKAATALVRYTTTLSVDKAFFDAGLLNRQVSVLNTAFVFFNRFLDITDLVEEPESVNIDNSDFTETDIPSPYDVPLPSKLNFSEDAREEIREWVLENAMASEFDQTLSKHVCDNCSNETYNATLSCHNCQQKYEPCVVTGFPVMKATRVQCNHCAKVANRDDWNKYVAQFKTCPWCGSVHSPVY
eukprot:TRINITY_DN63406_c0_g1_i1.p1 TRINITY_DN63406_c0_g1~~TRINITY_DN63406_c0_g1_i1.p1  ORF type:complete len:1553 (+),score=958.06 TRINITY_DN63406_c0_g1_i1:271-4659(+)